MWSVVVRIMAVFAACATAFAAGSWLGGGGRGLELAAALGAGAILILLGRFSAVAGSQSRPDREADDETDDRASV